MDGVLNLNKPSGPTSHDIVAAVRRAAGQKRVGHTGTLDPAASGVLVVCLGSATRIVEYLAGEHKVYRASMVFGVETDTQDQTGGIVHQTDCGEISREQVEDVLPRFTGDIMQVPPMVSAVHHEGRRLYELARSGVTVERKARPVHIYSLKLEDFRPGPNPEAMLEVECSSGTYIRTLCADIGEALGCGAHMSGLLRVAVGAFTLDDAVSLETVREKGAEGRLQELLHPMDEVLSFMPAVDLDEEQARLVMHGVVIEFDSRVVKLPLTPGGSRQQSADSRQPGKGRCTGQARKGRGGNAACTVGALGSDGLAAVPISEGAVGARVRVHGPDAGLLAIGKVVAGPGGETLLKPDKVFQVESPSEDVGQARES